METLEMFRTPLIAALTVALLGGTAMAQPANAPPSNLSNSARSAPDYDDDDRGPPADQRSYDSRSAPRGYDSSRDRAAPPPSASRPRPTATCSAAAMPRPAPATPRPREAARDEQTRGTVGGTLGGAALGAVLGAAAGNAGLGAAAGAGAGLIAGTAIGADNARHAASDVQAAYGDAYYACMHEDGRRPATAMTRRRGLWLLGDYPPPPPVYYGPAPYGYPYYPNYYGPSLSFGFGFGGGHGWGGHRGFHGGGWRHR